MYQSAHFILLSKYSLWKISIIQNPFPFTGCGYLLIRQIVWPGSWQGGCVIWHSGSDSYGFSLPRLFGLVCCLRRENWNFQESYLLILFNLHGKLDLRISAIQKIHEICSFFPISEIWTSLSMYFSHIVGFKYVDYITGTLRLIVIGLSERWPFLNVLEKYNSLSYPIYRRKINIQRSFQMDPISFQLSNLMFILFFYHPIATQHTLWKV